jgi:hypothetical protein
VQQNQTADQNSYKAKKHREVDLSIEGFTYLSESLPIETIKSDEAEQAKV